MDFTLTADQAALSSAIERLAVRFDMKPTDFHGFALEATRTRTGAGQR